MKQWIGITTSFSRNQIRNQNREAALVGITIEIPGNNTGTVHLTYKAGAITKGKTLIQGVPSIC